MAIYIRISIGSCEIAVCTHAQYKKNGEENPLPRKTGATVCGLQVAICRNWHLF